MAGAALKEIGRRIKGVESTMQITKAMQLAASSKLSGARRRMEQSRAYPQAARRVIEELAASCMWEELPYMRRDEVRKRCCIVIAGDRGLAGSYNQNVFRAAEEHCTEVNACILPIGKRSCEYYERQSCELSFGKLERAERLTLQQCEDAVEKIMKRFLDGDCQAVSIVYTEFESVLAQRARVMELLPVVPKENVVQGGRIFEPGAGSILERFVPGYLAGVIYAAVCESVACEQAARRIAMDAAVKNAGEMLEQLTLRRNYARQSAITQEISEIAAGVEQ